MPPASRGRSLARSGCLTGCLLLCGLSAAVLRLGGYSRPAAVRASRRLQETDGAASLLSSRVHGTAAATEPDTAADVTLLGPAGSQPADFVSGQAVSLPENQSQQASTRSTPAQHRAAQARLLADVVMQEPSSGVSAADAPAGQASLQRADPAQSQAGSIGVAPLPANSAHMQPDRTRASRRRGRAKKRSAPVITLAAGVKTEAWWTRLATDTAKCGVRDAGKARLLGSAPRESGDACESACRWAVVAQSHTLCIPVRAHFQMMT